MKQLYNFLLVVVFTLAATIQLSAQSDSCYNASPFCDSVNQYAATVNGPTAPTGNNYGCLGTQPNPTFFTLTVSQSGSIDITLLNTAGVDIDFILWGPYSSAASAQASCGNLGNGLPGSGNVVDTCSYSGAAIEYVQVSNAQQGDVYILMITNFANSATNIYSTTNSGTGNIACPCDLNFTLDTLAFPVNNGFLTDTTNGIGQYVVCPGQQLGIQINAGGNTTDTLALYAPYTTIQSAFPTSTIFTQSGLNHDTISIGALITPTQSDVGVHNFNIAIQATTPTNICQEVIPIQVIVPGIDLRDTTICAGDSILIPMDTFPNTYVGFAQYQWTQIAGVPANISNDTLAQPWIGAPNLAPGVAFDSIVLEVQFNYGGCLTIDTISIIVIGIPDATFNYASGTYCQQAANPVANIQGTPGGTFTGDAGVVFANTSTGEIDIANTTTGLHNIFYNLTSPGGQCDARDTFVISVIGITTFDATASEYFICPNALDTIQLNLNVVYGGVAPPTGSYAWTPTGPLDNPNIQSPTAILLTPDTFIVTYNDGVCDQQMDTVSISAPYPINLTVSPDVTVCNGGSVQLGANVAAGPGSQNFNIPAPSTVVVEDTTFVTLNVAGVAPGVINASLLASMEMCLDLNVNAIGHLNIYLVAPNGQQVQIMGNHGGIGGTLTGATFGTNPSYTSLAGFTGPFPPIPANSNLLPMGGVTGFNGLLGANSNGAWTLIIIHNNGGLSSVNGTLNDWCLNFQDLSQATFNWSPNYNITCLPCDSPTVSPTVDTTYMVIAQNAFGCIDTGFVNVTIDSALPAPILTCGTITPNSVTFNWVQVVGAGGYSVSINGAAPTIVPVTQDTFQVTGLTPGQCAQITVFALSGSSCLDGAPDSLQCCAVGCTSIDPIVIGANGPTTFCVGQSVTLDAGAGFTGYQWSTAAVDTNQTVVVTSSQLVSVTTTDALGCLDTGSIAITVTPGPTPTITASGSTTLCAGDSVDLDAGAGFSNYAWSPAGNTQIIAAATSGTYVVTVTDAGGCIGFDSIVVTIGTPVLAPVVGTDLSCNGIIPADGAATVTPSGGFGAYTYNWSAAAQNTATATGLTVGTHTVTVTDLNACTATASVTISEPSAVSATAIGNPVSCNTSTDGIARAFGAGGTVVGSYTFLWDATAGNQTTDFAVGLAPGNYCVTISDDNGCFDSTCVTILPTTHTFSASGDTSICEGDSAQLASSIANGYTWTPAASLTAANIQNPIAFPNTTTNYLVTSDILSGVNIIYNGDFEAGDAGFSSSYIVGTGGPFGQLSNAGTYAVNTNASNTHNNFAACTDHTSGTGNFMVVNGATVTNSSIWCQTVNVTPNTDYQFSTWVTSVVASNPAILQFSINGVNLSTPFNVSSTTCTWNQFFATWNSGANTTATICIVNQNSGNSGNDFGLDDIEFMAICNLVDSVLVNVNPKPVITPTNSAPVCANNPVNLFSNGGAIYNWSGPNSFTSGNQNPTIANAVSADSGLYMVTVTTAQGCSDTASTNVVINSHPSLSVSNTAALCFGTNTGTATANPAGGSAPFTYQWDAAAAGQLTQTATGLGIGTYQVTVVDDNGCSDTSSTIISQPTAVSVTVSSTPVSCFAGNDGTATATPSGGTPPYIFVWGGNPQTTGTITGLGAGPCPVTITDANGCTATGSTTITQPSAINFTIGFTDVTCNGGSDGTASINVSGGVGGFVYSWNNGQTDATATGLTAGLHCVTATDGNGCSVDTCIQVFEPAGFSNINFTTINVNCNGGNTGQASVNVSGGILPYSYAWPTTPIQTTPTATGLTAGVYTVTISDANGCSITADTTITEPTALQMAFDVDSVQCKNGSDGQIEAIVSGGTFPYTYLWNAQAGNQNTAIATGLSVGTYSVVATDFNGCTISGSATVLEPLTVLTASIINQSNPLCHGSCDGMIEVDAQGATPNYTYQWNNGQQTSIASGVCAGVHTVTVTDANGCSLSVGSVLTEPTAMTVNPQVLSNYNGSAISCPGANDGSVGVTAAGGSGGYSYIWSPGGQNTANISSLVEGTYCVTVTDVSGCTVDTCITINDPVQLAATFTQVDILCKGDANGQILANATTGTGTLGVNGYEYKITGPNQTGNVFSSNNSWNNLGAGAYVVSVRDGNNCQIQLPIQITEPDSVLIDSVVVTDALCFGTATGTATAHASGGVSGFTYLWSDGQITNPATGLAKGLYSVTVADANGCDRVEVFNVDEPTDLTGSISAGTIPCIGGTTTATASGAGGTPIALSSYLYNWSNGNTNATAINLAAGVHCVTITDDHACTEIVCVTISEPSTAVSAIISAQTDATCQGTATGTATAQGAGGTAGYTYLWQTAPAQATQTAVGLPAGVFTVVVTDTNGCTAQTSVTITEPSGLVATMLGTTNSSCFNTGDGTATVAGSGGTPGYSYDWGNGQTNSTATGLSAGAYIVTVSDANGCTATAAFNIASPTAVNIVQVNTTDVLCHGDATGTASISVNGGTPTNGYTYNWSGTTQTSLVVSGLSAGQHTVTATDFNGCFDIDTFVINEPAQALSGYTTTTPALCNGAASGQIGAVVQGGTAGYAYAWNTTPAQFTVVADSVAAGTYTVTITDANGCTLELTGTVNDPTPLSVTATVQNDVTCFAGNDGSATASFATGGTANYSYVWTDPTGQSGQVATGLSAGLVSVVVTDANGCSATASVTIAEDTEITLNENITNVSCFGGNDGRINIIGSNKTIVNYNWGSAGIGNPLSNLIAGTYNLTVTDNKGCQKDFIYDVIEPTELLVTATQTVDILCYNDDNARLQATATGGTANYSYNWSHGPNTGIVNNIAPGVYTVTATDSKGCNTTTTITVNEPEELLLSGTTTGTLCAGDQTGSIAAFGSGGTITSGLLQYSIDGATWQAGNLFPGLAPGIYTLSVQDQNGCTIDTALVVQDADPFFISDITPNTSIEYLDSMTIEAMVNDTTGVVYSWNQISGTNQLMTDSAWSFEIAPDEEVHYLFTATNANGCTVDSIVIIEVSKPRRANAAQAFTPNGDGVNDYFFIQGGTKIQQVTTFRVYDRWGELVFDGQNLEPNVPEQGWNGDFRFKPSSSGSYIWYSEVLFKDGHTEVLKGDVTLLR